MVLIMGLEYLKEHATTVSPLVIQNVTENVLMYYVSSQKVRIMEFQNLPYFCHDSFLWMTNCIIFCAIGIAYSFYINHQNIFRPRSRMYYEIVEVAEIIFIICSSFHSFIILGIKCPRYFKIASNNTIPFRVCQIPIDRVFQFLVIGFQSSVLLPITFYIFVIFIFARIFRGF